MRSDGTALPKRKAHWMQAVKELGAFLPAACDMALFAGADC